ncbi:hypothetical protein ACGFSB_33890, partial [Streptomyces sp. NPDC048441]|uniref:hypothetical protein n=1 Tax=Streptomyces sp. NPDC048441 TaxID=3365552 RepID=UPI00372060AC
TGKTRLAVEVANRVAAGGRVLVVGPTLELVKPNLVTFHLTQRLARHLVFNPRSRSPPDQTRFTREATGHQKAAQPSAPGLRSKRPMPSAGLPVEHAEAMLILAAITLMTRRIARPTARPNGKGDPVVEVELALGWTTSAGAFSPNCPLMLR